MGALVRRDLGLLVQQEADLRDDPSDAADFVFERLEGILEVPVEFVRAARASGVTELGRWPTSPGPWPRRPVAGVRAGLRRLRPLEPPGGARRRRGGRARPALATDAAEKALIEALGEASPRIDAAIAERDFRAAIAAAAELGPPVDRFFDEVLVMAEDERVRANRLRLLLDVRDAVGALGDLSQIPR